MTSVDISRELPSSTSHEQRMKEADEQKKKRKLEELTLMVTVVEQNMNRLTLYKDPVTNNCIFLEKLLMVTDVAKGFMLSNYDDLPCELCCRIDNLVGTVNSHIEALIDMIQQPGFSAPVPRPILFSNSEIAHLKEETGQK
jgi:hypothetical protein